MTTPTSAPAPTRAPPAAPRGRREVLLYGTSANPLAGYQGHMGAVAFCRPLFDEIWLLPVYQHIYSSKRQLAPFEHRLEICRLATATLLADHERQGIDGADVQVQELERELFAHHAAKSEDPTNLRLGSIDLVRFAHDRYPDADFTMLLGADTFADLRAGKWKDGDELQRRVKLLVMRREGYPPPSSDGVDPTRVRFITVPSLNDMSSTAIRAITDPTALREAVFPAVADYIIAHKLYGFAEQ